MFSGKSLRLKIKLPKAAESPSHGDGVWEPTQEKRATRQRKDKRKRGKAEDEDYEMVSSDKSVIAQRPRIEVLLDICTSAHLWMFLSSLDQFF